MAKNGIFLVALLGFVLVNGTVKLNAQCTAKTTSPKHTWHKSIEGTWKGMCNGVEYTYRVNNGKLKQKCNESEWIDAADQFWYDHSGKKHRYVDNAVSASTDGVNWSEVNGSYWLSSDGYWYRLDKNEEIWWDKFDKMEKHDW
jgi:hypothetical protein